MSAPDARSLRAAGGAADGDAIAAVRAALAELERCVHPAAMVAEAERVLARFDEVQRGSLDDGARRSAWADVAEARAAIKHLGETPPPSTRTSVLPTQQVAIERARRAVEEAEEKARRSLASPKSFKRLVVLRRELESLLEVAGFADLDVYLAALDGADEEEARARAEHAALRAAAQRRLEEAEAAWRSVEAHGGVDEVALDAVRASAYRLLGRVVDDGVLRSELLAIGTSGEAAGAAAAALATVLRRVGVDPGADAAAVARGWLAAMDR